MPKSLYKIKYQVEYKLSLLIIEFVSLIVAEARDLRYYIYYHSIFQMTRNKKQKVMYSLFIYCSLLTSSICFIISSLVFCIFWYIHHAATTPMKAPVPPP